jgi:hypothetical protein
MLWLLSHLALECTQEVLWAIFQPSLRDWSGWERTPSTACWAKYNRPLRDWSRYSLIADPFSASAVQLSRWEKLIWTSLILSRPGRAENMWRANGIC